MRCRCAYRVALCLCAAVSTRAPANAANLAPDSSFERRGDAWALHRGPGAAAELEVVDGEAAHGDRFAAVRASGGRVVLHSIAIPAAGGADYTLSVYARTRGAVGARLALWFFGDREAAESWDPDHVGDERADGLLANPRFEEGGAGWELWHADPSISSGGVGPDGRGGSRAFHVVNPGQGGANLHSAPVPCEGGRPYLLSVYARVKGGDRVGVAGWARDRDGKTLSYAVDGAVELPSDVPEFRRFAKTFVAPAGAVELKAHLTCNGGEVWWDDCRLVSLSVRRGYELPGCLELPADQPCWARFKHIVQTPDVCRVLRVLLTAEGGEVHWDAIQLEPGRDTTAYRYQEPPTGRNVLPNSDFEDGDVGWSLWRQNPGVSSGAVMTGAGRHGSRAFHVSNPGQGGANLFSEPVPCDPGATVTLSCHARARRGRGLRLAVWGVDSSARTVSYGIDGDVPIPGDLPEFARFAKTVTAPENVTGLKAHLICNGGEVWWDDIQLESGEEPTAPAPGPRLDVLEPYRGPAAAAYARAIVREARIRDVLAQTERLPAYRSAHLASGAADDLRAARAAVARLSQMVGAPFLVPDYRDLDAAAFEQAAERAESLLKAVWERLGQDAAAAFEPWNPSSLPPNIDADRLVREFLIFPCFTRPTFFRGEGNWDILEPFGFRVVSGWWPVRCQRDGTPDTAYLDDVLRQCAAHGYVCDIGVDPARAAAHALGDGEALFLHNADGGWSRHGNCHNTVNIWHPEIRRVAATFLEKLAARYAAEPTVLSCELTNEPSLTIEQHVHGYEYRPDGVGGYSPQARAAWRSWLADRYGDVQTLNRRWRTEYATFGEVTPPSDLRPPTPAAGDEPLPVGALHDFQCFRAVSHAQWFGMCLSAFDRGDPRKAVISQFVSGPVDRKDAAVDLRLMAEIPAWDIYGTHDWPGAEPAVRSLYAVSMNRRARHPHWEDEFIWSQWERKGTPEPVMRAALERNLWRQIAWGKRGISLFNLESEWAHDSARNWNNSLLNIEADLAVPRYCTGVVPTIERKVNAFKHLLHDAGLGPVDVAILRPTASTLVAAPDHRVRKEAAAIARYLLQRHTLPVMVPEEHVAEWPAALEGVRVLIAPWAVHVPAAVQLAILRWVRAGGVLIASGPFGLFDEHGTAAGEVLCAAVGRRRWTYDARQAVWRCDGQGELNGAGRLGRGRVRIDLRPFLGPERLALLRDLVREAVPVPFVQTDVRDVEVVPWRAKTGDVLLFVTNLSAREARRGVLTVRGQFGLVRDVSCEGGVDVTPLATAGMTTGIPLRLAPGAGAVFHLTKAVPSRTTP